MDFKAYTKPNGPYATIDGWNEHGAFTVLSIINEMQATSNVSGHVCEIGVHQGQFFFAMALLTEIDRYVELSVAIDVFDRQDRNVDGSGCADREVFERNAKRFLGPDNGDPYQTETHCRERFIRVIQADSLDLEPHSILEFIKKSARIQGMRLVSIDGGHTRIHVLNDLRLVERLTVPGGVVIVDDFMHPKWPGVTEGLHVYCADAASRLVPFAYGNKKMYLTTFDRASGHREMMANEAIPVCRDSKRVELYGRELIWVDME